MPTPQPPAYAHHPSVDADRGPGALAVTALVVGLAAFLLGLVPFLGLLVGAAAVVLGVLALRRSTRGVGTGWTFGLVGLVTGGVAVLASLVTSVLFVLGLAGLAGTTSTASSTAVPAPSPSRTSAPSPSATRSTPSDPAGPSTPAEPTAPSGGPGETVAAANGVSYTLTGFTCGLATIGEGSLTVTASGQYCLADVTVANGSSAPVRFYPTFVSAYRADVQFAADVDASIYADPRAATGPVNPGQDQQEKIAFDVPPDVALDRIALTLGYEDNGNQDDPGVSIRLS